MRSPTFDAVADTARAMVTNTIKLQSPASEREIADLVRGSVMAVEAGNPAADGPYSYSAADRVVVGVRATEPVALWRMELG